MYVCMCPCIGVCTYGCMCTYVGICVSIRLSDSRCMHASVLSCRLCPKAFSTGKCRRQTTLKGGLFETSLQELMARSVRRSPHLFTTKSGVTVTSLCLITLHQCDSTAAAYPVVHQLTGALITPPP